MPSHLSFKLNMSNSSNPSTLFNLNGLNYDSSQLPPEGRHLLGLLNAAQTELTHIDVQKALLQAAQQELINQLKPFLPTPFPNQPSQSVGIIGSASEEIPTTPAKKPNEEVAPFPNNLPKAMKIKP